MDSPTILWVTTAIMTIGGLAILATGKRRTPSEEMQTVLHGIVPLIAACSYFAMAAGQGAIGLPTADGSGRILYFARYIDWTLTTPLLLISLTLMAMHAGPKRAGALTGVVLADVMMILTALFFGLSENPVLKWAWFAISCVAFLGVYYVLFVPNVQANAAERDDVRTSYRRFSLMLSVLWFIYPIVLAVSPDGLGTMGDAWAVLLIAVLDVLTKVVYGLMTVAADAKTTERDLSEQAARTAPLRTAA